jgi:hypothetical protein
MMRKCNSTWSQIPIVNLYTAPRAAGFTPAVSSRGELVDNRASYKESKCRRSFSATDSTSFVFAACVAVLMWFQPLAIARAEAPGLNFDGKSTFEVVGLSKDHLKAIEVRLADKSQSSPLAVFVVGPRGDSSKTPLAGTTSLEKGVLRFRPRFPLEPGTTYRASFESVDTNANQRATVSLTTSFTIPKKAPGPATTVVAVYPTQDVLPENQLKFYLHFSAPMSRGEAYSRVHLLDDKGKAVDLPFLELEQELWDSQQKRLTLLFDPGRIKRGLKPREDVGPVLEEGKKYTFVVDADWLDAQGNPLAQSVRKSFRAGPPDDEPIDLAKWKIAAPRVASREPLSIQFPKALDHALAERLVWVETAQGVRVPGTALLADKEHRWTFNVEKPWAAGDYRVAVDSTVEDLAGNSVGKPFEIDVLRPVEKKVEAKVHYLPFAVR